MQYKIIGRIQDGQNTIGYQLLTDGNKILNIPKDEVLQAAKQGIIVNAGYNKELNTLLGKNNTDLRKLPVIQYSDILKNKNASKNRVYKMLRQWNTVLEQGSEKEINGKKMKLGTLDSCNTKGIDESCIIRSFSENYKDITLVLSDTFGEDMYFSNNGRCSFGVTELITGELFISLYNIDNGRYEKFKFVVVDDILYIGGGNILYNTKPINGDKTDTVIMLGKSGLIIIRNGSIRSIPYSFIKSIDGLDRVTRSRFNFSIKSLSQEVIKVIIYKIYNNTIKVKKNIYSRLGRLQIFSSNDSEQTNFDKEQYEKCGLCDSIDILKYVYTTLIECRKKLLSDSTHNFMLNKNMTSNELLTLEVIQELSMIDASYKSYDIDCNLICNFRLLVHDIPSDIFGSVYFIIQKSYSNSLSTEDYLVMVAKQLGILNIIKKDSKYYICYIEETEDDKIFKVYDLMQVIKLVINKVEAEEKEKERVMAIRNKMISRGKLLGQEDLTVNRDGTLVNWTDNKVINLGDGVINKLVVSTKNCEKKLTAYLVGPASVETYDTAYNNITFVVNKDTLSKIPHIFIHMIHSKVILDLNGITADELDTTLGRFVREIFTLAVNNYYSRVVEHVDIGKLGDRLSDIIHNIDRIKIDVWNTHTVHFKFRDRDKHVILSNYLLKYIGCTLVGESVFDKYYTDTPVEYCNLSYTSIQNIAYAERKKFIERLLDSADNINREEDRLWAQKIINKLATILECDN